MIKKIKAPIGDENVSSKNPTQASIYIKKIKAPIGDENGVPIIPKILFKLY